MVEVMDWQTLVTVQEHAVVSREIVHKPGGTVTVFAFDAGEGLSEHTAPFDALVVVLEGEVEVRIAGKSYLLRAGKMIVMPAHEPHALKALTAFKMLLVMFKA